LAPVPSEISRPVRRDRRNARLIREAPPLPV
jgi:hypothetical protein